MKKPKFIAPLCLVIILSCLNLNLLPSCKRTDAKEYYNRGYTYYQSKDYQKAIESYKEAIRIKPDYVEAYCNLGIAYKASGDNKNAIESYKEAIRLKPNYAEAYCNLGVAYGASGDSKKEIEAYKEAIRLKPNYVNAHYNLVLAYFRSGDRRNASEEYKILKGLNKEMAAALSDLLNSPPGSRPPNR